VSLIMGAVPTFETVEEAKQWKPNQTDVDLHPSDSLVICKIGEGPDLGRYVVLFSSDIEKVMRN
jgi:hypothetical protein